MGFAKCVSLWISNLHLQTKPPRKRKLYQPSPSRAGCHQHPTDSVFPKHFTPHPPPHPQRAARDSTPTHLKQGNPYPFPHLPLMPPGILQTTSAAGFPPFHLIHLRSRHLTSIRAPSSQVLKPSASFLSGLTGHRKALRNRPSLRDLK